MSGSLKSRVECLPPAYALRFVEYVEKVVFEVVVEGFFNRFVSNLFGRMIFLVTDG